MNKAVKIKIGDNLYDVGFPNTGQFIDIQTLKSKITENQFSNFIFLERDGLMATVIVNMIATFNVMIGEQLHKDLNVKGLLQLDLEKTIELSYIFQETYVPFYEEIMTVVSQPKKEVKKENKESVETEA